MKSPGRRRPVPHVLLSPVSVSVIGLSVSTAAVFSLTFGVVSAAEYVGVWSLTSVRVSVKVASALELMSHGRSRCRS